MFVKAAAHYAISVIVTSPVAPDVATVADVVVDEEPKLRNWPGVTVKYSPPLFEAGICIPLGIVPEVTVRLLVDCSIAAYPAKLEITLICWVLGKNVVEKTVGPAPAEVGI